MRSDDLEKQLFRYSKAVDEDLVQEAQLIVRGNVDDGIKKFISDNNLKVKIIENRKWVLE